MTAPTDPPVTPPGRWPDNPNWHHTAAAGHWMPPHPCGHPDDRIHGPCSCRAQDQP